MSMPTTSCRRVAPRILIAVLLALAVSVCGQDNATSSLHVDEIPELGYAEELRIGSLDDPDAGFSRIRRVRVSERGEVYVLDMLMREVRVFSTEGEHIRSIGGEGEGPGEFLVPSNMGLLGDTLWVNDPRARRITWFGPDGGVLFTTPTQQVPIEAGVMGLSLSVAPAVPQPDGLIESDLNMFVGGNREIRPYRYPVVRFNRDGEVVDTARWETADESAPTYRIGGGDLYAPYLGPLRPVEAELGDGRVVLDWSVPEGAAEGTLEVVRLGPEQDTLYRREIRYEAISVPAEVLDSLVEPRLGMARSRGVSEGELERTLRSAVQLPDFRPPLRTVHAGADGSVWIQLNTVAADTASWVVIGADGRVQGTVSLPSGVQIHHSDLPAAWAVELDEYGVPWLLRLKLSEVDESG